MTPRELALKLVHGDEDRTLKSLPPPPPGGGLSAYTQVPIPRHMFSGLYAGLDVVPGYAVDTSAVWPPTAPEEDVVTIRTFWNRETVEAPWVAAEWAPLMQLEEKDEASGNRLLGAVLAPRPGRFGQSPER